MIVTQDVEKIKVSFPQGAGGHWLSSVLYSAVTNQSFERQTKNFHNTNKLIDREHSTPANDQTISIDSNFARFNFWTYYMTKRILKELPYERVHGKRLPKFHLEDSADQRNFFSLIDQSRFILSYKYQGQFQIEWTDLWQNPNRSWDIICKFLDQNDLQNYWNLSRFEQAVDAYHNTIINNRIYINIKHRSFQIWALGMLQNLDITPPFVFFDKFGSAEYTHWLTSHLPIITENTKQQMYIVP